MSTLSKLIPIIACVLVIHAPAFGDAIVLSRAMRATTIMEAFLEDSTMRVEIEMGLADVLVPQDQVRAAALELATEIAQSSPLGVTETRATLRQGLADRIKAATDHELEIQTRLRKTDDFKEGVKAMSERRLPNFVGQ